MNAFEFPPGNLEVARVGRAGGKDYRIEVLAKLLDRDVFTNTDTCLLYTSDAADE